MKLSGFFKISPFIFFLLFYIISSLIAGDFKSTPIVIAFLFASVYALIILPKKLNIQERIQLYIDGVANNSLVFMLLIFFLAGMFSSSASEMGCVTDTVNMILTFLPPKYILASIFIAGCFLSFGTGSGIGTIVALAPIAAGVANQTGLNLPMTISAVICGAMFGDNLSFISDTTIVAAQTQDCDLKDKFRVNIYVALPAAIAVTIGYIILGSGIEQVNVDSSYNILKIIPYIVVIVCSLFGMNVMLTLLLGSLLCGVLGISLGVFDFYSWMQALSSGIASMALLVAIIFFATGLIAVMKYNGGLQYVVDTSTKLVKGTKSAEFAICFLTGLVCACTANNTIAIMSVGDIVKDISKKFNVDKRKACGFMDIISCIVLETIPYSTHLLVAASLAGITTIDMLPYVFYPYALLVCLILAISFGLPRLKKTC